MIPQYSEGMPYIRIDAEKELVWIEKNKSDELERFYESCTDDGRIAISDDYGRGLHTFLKMIKRLWISQGACNRASDNYAGLKGADGRPVYFDENSGK